MRMARAKSGIIDEIFVGFHVFLDFGMEIVHLPFCFCAFLRFEPNRFFAPFGS